MRKDIVIAFLLFCLIPAISFGSPLKVEKGKAEEIYFEIKNNNNRSLYYTIYSVGGFRSIIFYYSQILLDPYETKYIKVIVFPIDELEPGSYNVELVAESRLDRITRNLEIEVLEKQVEIEIQKFSFNSREINVIFDISKKYDLILEIYRGEELIRKFEKEISPENNQIKENLKLRLGNYTAKLKLYRNNNLVYTEEKDYQKLTRIKEEMIRWDYLVAYGGRIIFYNEGDETEQKTFSLYVDKSQDLFFSSSGYNKKIDLGDRYKYIWEFEILPNQQYIISYSYNYSIIAVLILALLFLAFMLFLVTRKDLKLSKILMTKISEIEEGKEIKICLEILNKTSEEISNITLEDFVPPIFKLKKEFSVIKPKRIVKEKEERKLVWEIPRIEPKETRIFTYNIVPKVGVKGKYSFPLARVKYKRRELSKISFSNSLRIK